MTTGKDSAIANGAVPQRPVAPETMPHGPSPAGPGVAFAVASVASVQFGGALAARLFPLVGPLGAVSLRLVGATVALLILTKPWRVRWTFVSLRAAAVFGLVLTAMNTSVYFAIQRLPLATAITLEFLGPLGVAVVTGRSWRQRIWAIPAAVGVALLGGSLHASDLVGIATALTAAGCWAAYILLSQQMGSSKDGLSGLCVATVLGALIMTPLGVVSAGANLVRPSTLAVGLSVGLLSSAIPYSLDLLALRRLPTAVFGVLTSLNPAMAALAGYLVLSERLAGRDLLGVGFVIAASAGVAVESGSQNRMRRAQSRRGGAAFM